MSKYSDKVLEGKLGKLTGTTDAITVLASWILYHKRQHRDIVKTWTRVLLNTRDSRQLLCLMYLANDVLQKARRKQASEFLHEFKKVLPTGYAIVMNRTVGEEIDGKKTTDKLGRILDVWKDRQIYPGDWVEELARVGRDAASRTIVEAEMITNLTNTIGPLGLAAEKGQGLSSGTQAHEKGREATAYVQTGDLPAANTTVARSSSSLSDTLSDPNRVFPTATHDVLEQLEIDDRDLEGYVAKRLSNHDIRSFEAPESIISKMDSVLERRNALIATLESMLEQHRARLKRSLERKEELLSKRARRDSGEVSTRSPSHRCAEGTVDPATANHTTDTSPPDAQHCDPHQENLRRNGNEHPPKVDQSTSGREPVPTSMANSATLSYPTPNTVRPPDSMSQKDASLGCGAMEGPDATANQLEAAVEPMMAAVPTSTGPSFSGQDLRTGTEHQDDGGGGEPRDPRDPRTLA